MCRNQVISVGFSIPLSILSWAKIVVSVIERQRPQDSQVELLLCDASKAPRILGWRLTISLDKELSRVADYVWSYSKQYHYRDYVA